MTWADAFLRERRQLVEEFAAQGIPETLIDAALDTPASWDTYLFLTEAWGWKPRRAMESVRRFGPARGSLPC